MRTRIAVDAADLGQRISCGHALVENINSTEARQRAGVVGIQLGIFRFIAFVRAATKDRGKDHDSFFALLDVTSQGFPCLIPGHVRCMWASSRDKHHVEKTVAVESAHCCEIIRQTLHCDRN